MPSFIPNPKWTYYEGSLLKKVWLPFVCLFVCFICTCKFIWFHQSGPNLKVSCHHIKRTGSNYVIGLHHPFLALQIGDNALDFYPFTFLWIYSSFSVSLQTSLGLFVLSQVLSFPDWFTCSRVPCYLKQKHNININSFSKIDTGKSPFSCHNSKNLKTIYPLSLWWISPCSSDQITQFDRNILSTQLFLLAHCRKRNLVIKQERLTTSQKW